MFIEELVALRRRGFPVKVPSQGTDGSKGLCGERKEKGDRKAYTLQFTCGDLGSAT